MRCVLDNERFAVYDDFLAKPDFSGVWRFVQSQRYQRVHAEGWQPVWRMHDGEPWASAVVHSAASRDAETPRPTNQPPVHVYPTNTHLDRLIEEICLHAGAFEPLVGARGRDWSILTARAYLYPKETGLGWHTDGPVVAGAFSYTGAFSYYAHPAWSSDWGGEFFAARLPSGAPNSSGMGSGLDPRTDEALGCFAFGDYVSPKPNRLIVLKAGTFHRINPVHPAAGATVRCSISGFFARRAPPAL